MCITLAVHYARKVKVGVEKKDVSMFPRRIIYFVTIVEKVLSLITGYGRYLVCQMKISLRM
jgi:hypothetical protein